MTECLPTTNKSSSIDQALLDALPLLRSLPRVGECDKEIAAQLSAFRASHRNVCVDLVLDRQPGHPEVDFDLLLSVDQSGTIAVGWRPDRAMPWSVQYAEHWASNLVLSVNGLDLTVQEALQALRLNGNGTSDLSTALVNYCLIAKAITQKSLTIADNELQDAADDFRSEFGLISAESTVRWLADAGLSNERFEALMKARALARKLKEQIALDNIQSYFATHQNSLARATVVRIRSTLIGALKNLIDSDSISGLVNRFFSNETTINDRTIEINIETGFVANILPTSPPPANPREGAVIGPFAHGGEFCAVQFLRHTPAMLDQETHRLIENHLFKLWLENARAMAEIRWHWM